ncbi:MAG: hypothetical protein KDA37_07845 [Planctomycetales bacterium]|nr:hypothetical protein [Planctomycetales bacterium]
MAKAMTILGMVVAALLVMVFALDLLAGQPFGKASPMMDIGLLVCSLILAYSSWNAFRDAG